jgi:septal ring factor EnvC (AmiA/AmiB activator)
MSTLNDWLEKIIGWVIPIGMAVAIYSFKDRIARASTETSTRGDIFLNSTMVVNAIKEIEKQQTKLEEISKRNSEIEKNIAVMMSESKTNEREHRDIKKAIESNQNFNIDWKQRIEDDIDNVKRSVGR